MGEEDRKEARGEEESRRAGEAEAGAEGRRDAKSPLEELLRAVERAVPLAGDVRELAAASVRGALEKSGWVTMDELEATTRVLQENRRRLEELERRVAKLEAGAGRGAKRKG